MASGDSDRAVSALIGFIFVFAAVVITMSVMQATLVPQQNQAVEFDHNQRVQADMQTVRGAIIETFESAGMRSVPVELGTSYPSRLVFINPAPATGTIETVGTESGSIAVTIANASAAGNAGDYWDGSDRRYATGSLTYRPAYNHYRGASSTVYENSVLYNQFEDTGIPITSQGVIDGRTISLVTVDGTLSVNGFESKSIDVQSVSASKNKVALANTGGNVTISLPTQLSASTWSTLLDEEFVANGSDGHIVAIAVTPIDDSAFHRLTIELEPNTTYELRLAKVEIGTGGTHPETGYVVDVEGNNTNFPVGEEQRLVTEVRDRFNNPQSGARVTFTTDDGSFHDGRTETTVTTDTDGRASVAFTSSMTGDATVRGGIDWTGDGSFTDEPANMIATFQLEARQTGRANNYTLNDPTDIVLDQVEITGERGNTPTFLNITFDNTAATAHTIEQIRIDHYHSASATRPANWSVTSYAPGPHTIGGSYVPLAPTVTLLPGETHEFEIELLATGGENYEIESSHRVFLSVRLADGSIRTYAIQPASDA